MSRPKGCAAVRFPGRELSIPGIAIRESISLIERAGDLGGPSAALLQMRATVWTKQARHADSLAVVYFPCAETLSACCCRRTSALKLPFMSRKSRGCSATQVMKTSVLNRREFRFLKITLLIKRKGFFGGIQLHTFNINCVRI